MFPFFWGLHGGMLLKSCFFYINSTRKTRLFVHFFFRSCYFGDNGLVVSPLVYNPLPAFIIALLPAYTKGLSCSFCFVCWDYSLISVKQQATWSWQAGICFTGRPLRRVLAWTMGRCYACQPGRNAHDPSVCNQANTPMYVRDSVFPAARLWLPLC